MEEGRDKGRSGRRGENADGSCWESGKPGCWSLDLRPFSAIGQGGAPTLILSPPPPPSLPPSLLPSLCRRSSSDAGASTAKAMSSG
jgi:hypothetical protein